jgi:AraC-like DNA-binding protein
MQPAQVRVLPTPFLAELRPAPQRSGETLQSAVETQSVAKRGRDAAASSKAACRLPPSFPPTDEIRSKFGWAHQTGDHGKRRHCFPTRRCADYASSRTRRGRASGANRDGRPGPCLVVQLSRSRAQLFGRASINQWDRSSARLYTNIRDTRPFPARNHCRSNVCAANQGPAANLFTETLFNAACARILRNYAEIRYLLSGPPRLTDDQLRAAIDYIHDHIRESLELRSISRAAGLSEFHFARLFKAATGVTPFQFVTRTRMERAKELLRKTRLPIFEIAERVGYQKPSHFSARFRTVSGCGPDAYRKSAGR